MTVSDESTARARIRDAALDRFGRDGVNRVTVRAIAADAGVSPALVVHHFGSKEALRRECDAHVVAMMRGTEGDAAVDDAAAGNTSGFYAMLEAATPARRYLARAFLDGSSEAAALFDEIVELATAWLAEGERQGWAQPTEHPHTRAAIYVSWLLAPLVFNEHLSRVLGVEDLHGIDSTVHVFPVTVEMLTYGVFAGDRVAEAWDALKKEWESQNPTSPPRFDKES